MLQSRPIEVPRTQRPGYSTHHDGDRTIQRCQFALSRAGTALDWPTDIHRLSCLSRSSPLRPTALKLTHACGPVRRRRTRNNSSSYEVRSVRHGGYLDGRPTVRKTNVYGAHRFLLILTLLELNRYFEPVDEYISHVPLSDVAHSATCQPLCRPTALKNSASASSAVSLVKGPRLPQIATAPLHAATLSVTGAFNSTPVHRTHPRRLPAKREFGGNSSACRRQCPQPCPWYSAVIVIFGIFSPARCDVSQMG